MTMANASVATLVLILLAISAKSKAADHDDSRKPYIIHMIRTMKPLHFNLHHHWYDSMLHQVSQSDSPSELLYTYDTLFHGFAARLTRAEAEAMESMQGCLAVIPSSRKKITTTRTPQFLNLASSSSSSSGLWSQYSTYGEDIIIGVIDTGIWPESQSFSDEGLGPVPARWKGNCENGQEFNSSNCNRKIIGARYFFKGYENETRINQTLEYKSPRDNDGHGTHTASTIAGAAVPATNFFGYANGTATGMAPRARLAIYKVCWREGCEGIDVAAAMEQAVVDGVDILSISLGSSDVQFPKDPTAVAAFGAIEKGVFVSAAVGNDGPFPSTLSNAAPWFTTVGASTIDRHFPASVVLGNQEIYRGSSNYKGKDAQLQTSLPLVYASATNSSRRCLSGSLDPNLVKGKIVVCDQLLISKNEGESDALVKGFVVAEAGGAGIIVANDKFFGADEQITNVNNLPAIFASFTVGEKIKAYIKVSNGGNCTATMSFSGLTEVGNAVAAPIVAAFSSRGPSSTYPHILKPDMIAPGVNILAAFRPRLPYYFVSGTSMACPHVSGIAALIKAIHPTWSPAAIKSALMTSSYIVDNTKQGIRDSATMEAADPFAIGAGHVDPRAAVNPGLVYDIAAQDYVNFVCTLNYTKQQIALLTKTLISCPNSSLEAGDLNYPSFSVLFNSGNKWVQVKRRTVTNVGAEGHAVYRVSVKSPPGVKISVQPETLEFNKLQDKASYTVRFETNITSASSSNAFGEIKWTCIKGGTQVVRSPVALQWQPSN
ncbi:hypothetical protein KI387_008009 [Taxus chinensis]|uniref:Subtilisin-like protease SBT1.7 n=1 Tax=Taxus chinensis TaxID=29808 RepID=A0AA38CN75_TAXCH|nr:hypothetical protein KI387_008009 [Taxus chinensis]